MSVLEWLVYVGMYIYSVYVPVYVYVYVLCMYGRVPVYLCVRVSVCSVVCCSDFRLARAI